MSAATSGFGTLLKHGDAASPEVFTTIAEIYALNWSLGRDTIDVTNHDSASTHREHIAGLRDGGELSGSANYLPANVTQHATSPGLIDDYETGVARNYQLELSDSGTTTQAFTAILTNVTMTAPIDDKLMLDFTMKVTAAPTLA